MPGVVIITIITHATGTVIDVVLLVLTMLDR